MTQTDHLQDKAEARAHGNRAHIRRKLSPMAYVELGQDNGGILLNLGEGGFAVQSALALTSREFSQLRFQVPALQGWLMASGRIVWLRETIPPAAPPSPEPVRPRRQTFDAPHNGGEAHEPSVAYNARGNATQTE